MPMLPSSALPAPGCHLRAWDAAFCSTAGPIGGAANGGAAPGVQNTLPRTTNTVLIRVLGQDYVRRG